MNENLSPNSEKPAGTGRNGALCPFLGFYDDPETAVAYPSSQNCCYHAKPVTGVALIQQRRYCLSKEYSSCPIYQKEKLEPLPKQIRGGKPTFPQPKPWIPFVGLAGVLVLILVASLVFGLVTVPGLEGISIRNTATKLPTKVITTETIPTETHIVSTVTATATKRVLPTKAVDTPIPTEASFHFIETPIATNPVLVIHQLVEGEGLIMLAQNYNTSVAAITAVNYYLPPTMWVGTVIVVPVGTVDVAGLPQFSTYEIKEGGLTIEELAVSLKLDEVLLEKYNALPDGYVLKTGEWLLIPQ